MSDPMAPQHAEYIVPKWIARLGLLILILSLVQGIGTTSRHSQQNDERARKLGTLLIQQRQLIEDAQAQIKAADVSSTSAVISNLYAKTVEINALISLGQLKAARFNVMVWCCIFAGMVGFILWWRAVGAKFAFSTSAVWV